MSTDEAEVAKAKTALAKAKAVVTATKATLAAAKAEATAAIATATNVTITKNVTINPDGTTTVTTTVVATGDDPKDNLVGRNRTTSDPEKLLKLLDCSQIPPFMRRPISVEKVDVPDWL